MATELITITAFAETHEVTKMAGYVAKSRLPEGVIDKGYINEKFFLRRKAFEKGVWLQAHDNYYFLTSSMSDYKLAHLIAAVDGNLSRWSSFINCGLFNLINGSILSYQINILLWKFFRITSHIIRRLFRLAKVPKCKRDLSVLINKEIRC